MDPIQTIKTVLASLVVLGQAIALIVLFGLIIQRGRLPVWYSRWAMPAAFTVAVVSMFGSLFYSEIVKLTPCELCWYQRILMYPLVFLLATALVREEKIITR